jgi:ABC-type antimicrobial peptide transport system permease subunit
VVCRPFSFRLFSGILAAALLFGVCALAKGGVEKARKGPPPKNGQSLEKIDQILKSLEIDLLLIQPDPAPSGGVNFGNGTAAILAPADAEAIARECRPAVKAAAPVVRARTRVVYRKKAWVPIYIYGTTPSFLDVRGWGIERGRRFTDRQVENGAGVCLLGQTLVNELFGTKNPLNQMIRVNNHPLKVVGILSRKGANVMGLDRDDVLLVPWTTLRDKVNGSTRADTKQDTNKSPSEGAKKAKSLKDLYPLPKPNKVFVAPPRVDQVVVKVASEKEIPGAIKKITALLRKRHHIARGEPDDFNIRDLSEMARALRSARELMKDKKPKKDGSRR